MTDDKSRDEIRQAYRISADDAPTRTIPAARKIDIHEDNRFMRVCAYCRVSTGNDEQLSSFVLQEEHYRHLAEAHTNWELKEVYADEGISGTSLKHRDRFNEMIAACRRGEYDLIITKSVSRFARNIVDCLSLVRELKNQNPPVGVLFETDSIYTLSEESELKLSLFASIAQAESEKKSEAMNWSLNERFKHNKLLTPELFGYRRPRDAVGNYIKYGILQIEESEAKVVQFMFNAFLIGYSLEWIADTLNDLGIKTLKGKEWSSVTIGYIIRNERYCGSVLTWKTFTADLFEHKQRKNRNNRDQCYYADHHPAIVSPEVFDAAQQLLHSRRHGMRGGVHVMHVIDDGVFQGYVPINHHWANDDPNPYYNASESVEARTEEVRQIRRSAFSVFDLSGYQVVRSMFLTARSELPCLTISTDKLTFNAPFGKKMADFPYMQLLLHPTERKIAVRPCEKDDKYSITMRKRKTGAPIIVKMLSAPFFIKALMQIMGWNPRYSYRMEGSWIEKGPDCIMVFNLLKAVPMAEEEPTPRQDGKRPRKKKRVLCPEEWEASFGDEFYAFSLGSEFYALRNAPNLQSGIKSREVEGQNTLQLPTREELLESATQIKIGDTTGDE